MKILKYEADPQADLQSTDVQCASALTPLEIQLTPAAGGLGIYSMVCRWEVTYDLSGSAPFKWDSEARVQLVTFSQLPPKLRLDHDLGFLNFQSHV